MNFNPTNPIFEHYIFNKKMNAIEERGTRDRLKGALKQKYAELTDDDQLFSEGEKQVTFGNFQINLGKTKQELQKIIRTL